ncbi:MAG TPA: hypothetical protein ENI81_13100 [Phycisphaerales bacterium]|nr:hypothetical protein [Phycisphaerales bacterium]
MVVLKSTNGGASWPIRSFPATGDYGTSCRAVAVAAGNPSVVYAGGQKDREPAILRSANAGDTWEDITSNFTAILPRYGSVSAIWVSPYDADAVVVGTSDGIVKCTVEGRNRNRTWNITAANCPASDFTYDRATGTIYAATQMGVLSSEDEGATWRQENDGLGHLESLCIDIDPVNRFLYVGTNGGSAWRLSLPDASGHEHFTIVDDFETYTDYNQGGEAVWQTWIDGFDVPTNGSQIGYLHPPYAERTIVHGGAQSMPYHYDNNLKYSEATMTLVSPRNWTMYNVEFLSLWFRGDPANAAESMYVAVADMRQTPAVIYHEDTGAARTSDWTQWFIDLSEFAGQGVDLTDVDRLSIGFGDKYNPQAGGSGLVFFDDIWLYRPPEQTN